jgi:hypothetical protein
VLENVLHKNKVKLDPVIPNPEKYKLRILYTQIDRDEENKPRFKSYYYGLEETSYFYPASTVKLPVALLALEKLNTLDIKGVDKYTTMKIENDPQAPDFSGQDSSYFSNESTVAEHIKKILLVSDNEAYNYLYEFTGQKYINETLADKGFTGSKIIRRLSLQTSPAENRVTNPVLFLDDGKILYKKPLERNPEEMRISMPGVQQGKGYYKNGERVNQPIDFSYSNYIPIGDLQKILKTILFPESVPENQRFKLTEDDYRFLYTYMSMLPGESGMEAYADTSVYKDSYVKYILYAGSNERIPETIRIFNKVGQAYGYLIENAYVVDFSSNVEFLITVVLQVNENRLYNDDNYEYESIGYPFMANLGRVLMDYEKERERPNTPDLSRFDVHER